MPNADGVQIVVAAPILARGEEEGARLRESVAALVRHGLPLTLADGGSPPAFLERLRDALPGDAALLSVSDPDLKMIAQVQAAFRAAAERSPAPDYLLYTEPDKHLFFDTRLPAFLDAAARHAADPPGVIVAARDAASFATFPAGQRLPESLFNTLAADALGLPPDADLLYGPLLLRADIAARLADLRENLGWGWRPYLMAVCRRFGASLVLHTDALPCPPDQQGEDDPAARVYRLEQMAQNVRGLALGLKTPLASAPAD